MKVLIVGSGLIGLTTAYFLACRRQEVTVIDRQEGPGRETSFANGALLTPAMSEPWNTPGCGSALLASLGQSDAALKVRLRALPSLARWGLQFLRHSRRAAFERSVRSNLCLGLYSLDVLASLRQRTGIEYGRSATGSLKIFRDHASLDRAAAAAARLASAGLHFRRLTPDEAVVLEPALAPIEEKLAGAIHYQGDETGDAYRFCEGLTACARQQDVEFRFATEVSALEVRSGQVVAVRSPQGRFVADHYVVTAASYSTPLLRGGGIQLPVRPAKGYSITFDAPPGQPPLSIPLIDDQLHAAVVPLQGAIRAAGTAEFAGFDLSLNHERVRNLVSLAQGMLPHAGLDPAAARPWCGLRPMSADGVPIIGPTPISNLWVNTGHGHLGWTMAAGSGRFLADLITGASPAIEPGHYSLRRFS